MKQRLQHTDGKENMSLLNWNDTARESALDRCIHEIFESQVRQTPNAIALVQGRASVSYQEINRRANQLCRRLRRLGVREGDVVGICMERSIELVVVLLAVLKAGGAYLPLGRENPDERLRFMIEDAGASLIIAPDDLTSRFAAPSMRPKSSGTARSGELQVMSIASIWEESESERESDRVDETGSEKPAYVMYTSGTTGEPKGIEAIHRAVVRLVIGVDYASLSSDEVFLQYAPISFDASTFEIWGCLLNGGRLVLAPPGQTTLKELGEIVARSQITTLFLTTGLFHAMVDERLEDLLRVRQLLTGGDVLSVGHARKVLEADGASILVNAYGPTEGTTFTTCNPMSEESEVGESVSIGRPISNTQVYVLDDELNPVAAANSGQLYVGGEGLANGYLRKPRLTAAKFLPNPYSEKLGSRMYQTGDRVRLKTDGSIEFLGRLDGQVKVRGFRVEMGEIEAILNAHPGVREGVVVAREDSIGQKRLIAYAVGREESLTAKDLREFMRAKLPEYMVPSAIVMLEELPLTASGKVDRKALPETGPAEPEMELIEPRTPIEELLAGFWRDILELERVGIIDDFFDLGGHSLTATRVLSRVQKSLGVELSVRTMFECPTIAELAREIETSRGTTTQPGAVPVAKAPRRRAMPLSFAQERMWFLDQLEPGNITYNVPVAIGIEGELNEAALEQSIGEIVRRHEVLRTTFSEVDGEPIQHVAAGGGEAIRKIDLRGLRNGEREETARELMREEGRRPFDLAKGPLLRAALVHVEEKKYLLLLTMHHIVTDGWSLGVLFGELKDLCASILKGEPGRQSDLRIQYGDFAYWQREWLKGAVLEAQLKYWRKQLEGVSGELRLPRDRERTAMQTFEGSTEEFRISEELSNELRELSRSERVSLFMTLLAGFKVVLNRYSGETDIVVGTPIANRNREELEELIGFFVNTLALRTDLSGKPSFKALLARIREAALAAYAHQDLPFEKLVEELEPERSLNVTPLFQVMFVLQNTPTCELELGAAKLTTVPAETDTTQFDLILTMEETGDSLTGTLRYNVDLFEQHTIRRMRDHLLTLFESAVEHPEHRIAELPILTLQEHLQIYEWNHTDRTYDGEFLIHALFEEQAEKTPDGIALVCAGAHVTYGELNRKANQLAHRLRKLGAAPEVRVGICAERGIDLVVGLLGILKSGGAYVPLDPEYPHQRLAYMLEDSRAEIVIVGKNSEHLVSEMTDLRVVNLDTQADGIADESQQNLPLQVTASNIAYVIYTSGSTGKPKGVMVSHASACNHLFYRQTNYPLRPEDRFLHKASFSFDISVWEIFGTLISGAKLIIASNDEYKDPASLVELIRNQRVTVMHSSPVLLDALLQEGLGECESVREVFCGGEPLRVDLQKRFFNQSKARLHNQYGPTETTIDVTFWECDPSADLRAVPIGRPIANTKTYVLNADLQPSPVGVSGELFVSGEALARGYLGRPGVTARSFIPDPFGTRPGARLYRTGDQVRYTKSGDIHFIGRTDNQVKVRGFRVEPGEIEAVLNAHPGVRESVVVAREDGSGQKRLMAYAVGQGAPLTARELKDFMREKLPEYMVPSAIIMLEELPLTANGKVDRKALPEAEHRVEEREWIEPRTPIEELLAVIWADTLKVKRVAMNDRFFDLGGHSLLASRMLSRIRSTFRVELPLRSIFEEPTVELLARRIEKESQAGRSPTPPITRAPREGTLPLSFAQQRLWFLDELEPDSTAYSIPLFIELDGPLDEGALKRAFGEIIRRHEILRTAFQLVDGLPSQVIKTAEPVDLPTIDLTALPESIREEELIRVAAWESHTRFDLSQGPLIRTRLIRSGELRFALLINMHHTVSDGWSLDVMWNELEELYGAFSSHREPMLPELPIQYADYAVWQRDCLQGEILEEQIEYWKSQLAGVSPIDLPADKPRELPAKSRGASEELIFSEELTAAIKRLGAQHAATPFMTLLAAFKVLLYRWTGQPDVAVGSPIAGRGRTETENLIGFFVNTIVLRADLSGNPGFSEVIRRVRETALGAYAHQEIPFEKLVEELQPERDLHRSPFFQIFFNMLGADRPALKLAGVSAHRRPLPTHESKFDLSLYAAEEGGRITLTLVYDADLFHQQRIAELVRQFEGLLTQAVDEPERPIKEFSLVTPAARGLLPDPRRAIERAWLGPVHDRVREHANTQPHRVAVSDTQVTLSYRDLDLASDRVANVLASKGMRGGNVVAVLGKRGAPLVVALLGVMKAGAAFTVIDPAFPDERLIAQLEAAAPRGWLITNSEISPRVEESLKRFSRDCGLTIDSNCAIEFDDQSVAGRVDSPAGHIDGDSLAYVAFTSGSTGIPKAILGTHAPLSHFLDWHCRTFTLNRTDRFCMLSGLSHDPLLRDIFTPLWIGATLCVPDADDIGANKLSGWMRREAISVAHVTPALAATLTEGDRDQLQGLRYAFFGGDLLTPRTLMDFKRSAPFAKLVNFYGTTETPQAMGYFVVEDLSSLPERVPLGRGIEDAQLLLLSESGGLAGVGELGEISVRTPYLTVGYANDAELTRARYVTNPITGRDDDRVYRTGDLGRYLPDGNVEFVGRSDEQVKIRGFRIELQEVRAALQTHAGVRDCAVVQREYGAGDNRLAAYVVPVEPAPSASDLRNHMSGRLPGHMLPSFFVMLDRLPLTPNGKLDRAALPEPAQADNADKVDSAPRTVTEELLSAIWSQVLQVERVGVNDNFFEIGGHSLLAMQVNSRVCETFHMDVPLRDLFTHPTIEQFARRLDDLRSGSTPQELPVTRVRRDLPLSFSFNEAAHLFADWYVTTIRHDPKLPFHLCVGLQISGSLNVPALEDALNEIIRRHEILRTAFYITADGSAKTVSEILRKEPREIALGLFKRSIRAQAPLSIAVVNTENLGTPEKNALVEREFGQPFDYQDPPMLRALLFKTAPREYRLTLLLHHLAFDGWSVHLLRKELASLYDSFSRGEPSSLDELPFQYVDFAEWQHKKMKGEFLEKSFAYWAKRLSDFDSLDARELPFPRPDVSTPGSAFESLVIDSDLLQEIRSFARARKITLSMLLLSILDSLLHLYTGKERIGVWVYFANRTRSGTDSMIGWFAHRHLVGMELRSTEKAECVLDNARDLVIDATANSELPYILVEMQKNGQTARGTFVQDWKSEPAASHDAEGSELQDSTDSHIEFDLLTGTLDEYSSGGLVIEPVHLPTKMYEPSLRFYGADRGTRLVLTARYPTDLFFGSTIREVLADFRRLLEGFLAAPGAPISSFAGILRAPYINPDETNHTVESV